MTAKKLFDVVVVGAGLSGLQTALTVRAASLRVCILDATRSRRKDLHRITYLTSRSIVHLLDPTILTSILLSDSFSDELSEPTKS